MLWLVNECAAAAKQAGKADELAAMLGRVGALPADQLRQRADTALDWLNECEPHRHEDIRYLMQLACWALTESRLMGLDHIAAAEVAQGTLGVSS